MQISIYIYSLFLLLACSQRTAKDTTMKQPTNHTTTEIMSYEAATCATKLYPMRVYRGDFYNEKDWVPLANGGFLEGGWGSNCMSMSHGNIIPTGFKITYFSYMENKFYKGDFALPADRIRSLFKEGMIDYLTKKYDTYNAMIVGMAPGGVLVVWMQGFDKQVEIGRFQATETDMLWESFIPKTGLTREEYVSATINDDPNLAANFEKNGLMLGLWDSYRIKYNWRPKFEFPEGSKVEGINLKMYNGEFIFLWGDDLAINAFEQRAITWRIHLLFTDETGQDFGAHIDFDEAEIFDAYKQIYRNDKEQNAELVIKYNDTRTSLEIYLRSKSEEIEIEKSTIKIYKRTK